MSNEVDRLTRIEQKLDDLLIEIRLHNSMKKSRFPARARRNIAKQNLPAQPPSEKKADGPAPNNWSIADLPDIDF